MQIIDDIRKNLDWLTLNRASNNITNIVIVIDDLSIQSATLGELKSDAYDLMSDLEFDYKDSVAKFVAKYEGATAKAERVAEVEYSEKKRLWKDSEKAYYRLKSWIDRLDKILDAHKQRVSVEKQTGLKHMTGT